MIGTILCLDGTCPTVTYLDMIQKALQGYPMIDPLAQTGKCTQALEGYHPQWNDWPPAFAKRFPLLCF